MVDDDTLNTIVGSVFKNHFSSDGGGGGAGGVVFRSYF